MYPYVAHVPWKVVVSRRVGWTGGAVGSLDEEEEAAGLEERGERGTEPVRRMARRARVMRAMAREREK